jgi:hypothetical protein
VESLRVTFTTLAVVLVVVACAVAQNGKSANPKIGAAFGKTAVKALLTIEGTRDKQLIDAAMIDLSAAHSTHAELKLVWHVQLFQQIYAIHEMAGGHEEDQGCLVAWLPKLRALSADIPKQCPHLSAEEMKEMAQP